MFEIPSSTSSPEKMIDTIFRSVLPLHGYAVREQQIDMAKAVYRGLTLKKVTLCEAEVGTGKTMAYLVAGLAAKRFDRLYRFQGYPVTITTSGIELQKSILEKEIPALSEMLLSADMIEKPITAVLRKGKEHYFCPRRYRDYLDTLELFPVEYSQTIAKLKALDLPSYALDLDPAPLDPHIKARICVKGSCYHCPDADRCAYAMFLAEASQPYRFDFQITNHNLFLAAQKARAEHPSKGSLLDCNFCVIDEAHKLVEAASGVYRVELGLSEVEDYLHAVKYNGGREFQKRLAYLSLLKEADFRNQILLGLFSDDQLQARELGNVQVEITEPMVRSMQMLAESLNAIGHWAKSNSGCAASLVDKLSAFFLREERDDAMVWLNFDKTTDSFSLCRMPMELKTSLARSLWTAPDTHFALTSGTMTDGTGFSFFKDELGITDYLETHSVAEHSWGSPFDYASHTRLYISEDTPIPDMRDPEYIPAVARELVKLVKVTHGHTAVLFTSYRALNAAFDMVKDELKEYPLIKMSRSNKTAIDQFKRSQNGVLFASGSMWEGVDCAGDILSSVIIVRLPFPLRSQAMELKRSACADTGEFVRKYAVPQMILKLRQGAGRLIRTETDTGVLAILDARAAKGGAYRARVLKALEKYPLVGSVEEVEEFMREVKDKSYFDTNQE